MLLASLDWSPVIVAVVAGVFSIINTVALAAFYWYIKPPSGGRLGTKIEETHANVAATVAAVTGLDEDTNGKETHPPKYKRRRR